jgi:endogenous inhibitor of DNA gyrase (YacG/DUF329 family)
MFSELPFETPDDELRDDEYPDQEDFDDEDELTLAVPCPNCGADVYEDAPQCPTCGEYVDRNVSALAGRPLWWIVLGILGIAAVVVVLSGW